MWVVLVAAVAAPVPARISLYSGCISVQHRPENCPNLVFDTAVYCCTDRVDQPITVLEQCSGPATEDVCDVLAITTSNSYCCNTPVAPDPVGFDSLADDGFYDFENR